MSRTVRAYYELTKPGITLFIGITAAAGFVTALDGFGMATAFVITMTATMLMSGGAATLNQVAERKWDALMRRTATRPIPSGVIPATSARAFGWALGAAGLLLSLLLPWPATLFLVLCHVSYVNLYTPLKRRTPLCTLAGAIPGALPVLAGWTATGAAIDTAAIALTGVLFMWQIPHFLAIGWLARDDYARAGCPMLTVVETSGRATARVSFVYTCATLICAIIVGVTKAAGPLYSVTAMVAGAAYIASAWRLLRLPESRRSARQLFFISLVVLPVLLSALMVDLVLLD